MNFSMTTRKMWPFNTGDCMGRFNCTCKYTIYEMEIIKLPFIDCDLLYTGALWVRFDFNRKKTTNKWIPMAYEILNL